MIKERIIKLKSEPRWVARIFILIGAILGGIVAFTSYPIKNISANTLDAPDISYYNVAGEEREIMAYNLGATTTDINDEDSYGDTYGFGINHPWEGNWDGFEEWEEGDRGPCPVGYHVPTMNEWRNLFVQWCEDDELCDTKSIYYVVGYEDYYKHADIQDQSYEDYDFNDKFRLPYPACITSSWMHLNENERHPWFFSFNSLRLGLWWNDEAGWIGSVRCFKDSINDDPIPLALDIYDDNGENLIDRIFVPADQELTGSKKEKLSKYILYTEDDDEINIDTVVFTEDDADEGIISVYAECANGYDIEHQCVPFGIYYEDGYIEVTDGKNTIYIKDRNQGASMSVLEWYISNLISKSCDEGECLTEQEIMDDENLESNLADRYTYTDYLDDSNFTQTYGNYYYRGNNNGVNYNELEVGEYNMNNWVYQIENMSQLDKKFLEGGKIGSDEGSGWIEGNTNNPCDSSKGEYLPSLSDWWKVEGIVDDVRGGNGNEYDDEYDENGFYIYRSEILLLPVGAVYIDGDGLNWDRPTTSILTAMDSGGNLGQAGTDGEGGVWMSVISENSGNWWREMNNFAAPVRCFIDPDYINGQKYSVTFNTMGGNETVESQYIRSGALIREPNIIPTKSGFTFVGWYTESGSKWNFGSDIVENDITLYARWDINKDIVIQATATEVNQTLKINKYFANDYTVDRGDGTTGNLTADITHTYDVAGIYEITLSLSGADRWTFTGENKTLVPKNGTTVTGVEVTYMPSLADGFGNSAMNPGDRFFAWFNSHGTITSLPEGSFDTSNIIIAGDYFFESFNSNGALISLPEGSFDTSNITTVGNGFFTYFNSYGSLTSLPEWSFDTSNITVMGWNFFANFNDGGKLTTLPDNSFNISKVTTLGIGSFGSFNMDGALTSLPAGSFKFSTGLTIMADQCFFWFNNGGQLESLPEGSFDTSNITVVGNSFFYGFNFLGALTSLPEGSFDLSNITTAGNNFFAEFNFDGAITYLPESFTMSSVGASVVDGYDGAFYSDAVLNRNVSDLVSGVTAPSSDRNTFSDNQPGRCGVDPNWLVNEPTDCSTITYMDGETVLTLQPSIVDAGSLITLPVAPAKFRQDFVGWYKESTFDTQWNEGVDVVTGNITLYAKYEPTKDIVIQATATAANQTMKINKYFRNAYTVDWGDGVTGDLIADTTHTYDTAGTYEITLSLSGADRWTFTGVTKPLVPKNGTTVTGVEIIYMPSLTDGFGDSATELGDYFFTYFNYNGKLTSLPANSFDTSNISGSVGNNFFSYFNQGGALTILPVGAFGLSNITTVGDSFFIYFNYNGSLTSLPVNSFDISNITTVGDSFFAYFNSNGKLTNLPANSFNTSNLMIVGDNFFSYFNQRGSLINLPEGSFSIPNIIAAGNNFFYSFNNSGQLTSLPVGSFDISSITTVGDSFFRSFNYNGKLTSLPANSFNTSNISGLVGNYFFDSFNYNGSLTELPIGSFDISSITKVSTINLLLLVGGTNFFSSFNKNGALTSLPVGSFNTSNISGSAGNYFFSSFNENGALTSLPVNSFDISSITTIGNNFFANFNSNGKLTSLPVNSFDTTNISGSAGNYFFYRFNNSGQLASLPGGSFNISNITTAGNYFFDSFNYNGSLTELPIGSFDTTNITIVGTNFLLSTIGGTNFFSSFNENGAIITLPEGSFDMSNISGSVGNCFFTNFNYKGAITSLPESFTMSSVGVSSASGYKNAFNSQSFTLDKNVSQLVLGLRTPSDDRNTFSDNQPGRCGVDPNWLVNAPTNCSTITYMDGETILRLQPSIVDSGSTITLPVAPAKFRQDFVGWYKESTFDTQWDEGVDAVIGNITLYAKYVPTKDIVLQATATAANQTLKINKYFANAYTVDRGDGTTGNITADTTHSYGTAGTYNIILSLSGVDRWTFVGTNKPLVPKYGTTVTGVQIIYMPSLEEGFGNSATTPGDRFFRSFNERGAITSLPEGSFDTSNITTVGDYFFVGFNYNGLITSLPEGSFRLSTGLTVVGNKFFSDFNSQGALTELPGGSFDITNITTVGDNFFMNFNYEGKITSLPEGSFDISNITMVGGWAFYGFNNGGALTNLPEGSFRFSTGLAVVGERFFMSFNWNGLLTSLPAGSFDTSNIKTVGDTFFSFFNYKGRLTSLPEGSFDTSNITTAGEGFFMYYNYEGELTSLPEGSFKAENIANVGDDFFSYFNYRGQIVDLPDSFKLSSLAYNKNNSYTNAFNSPNYTLNKKVSDLVSGVTAPLTDRNTFSDNQPGRCGVDPNWLVNEPTEYECPITYTITFNSSVANLRDASGNIPDSNIMNYTILDDVVLYTNSKSGYTFNGWDVDSANSGGSRSGLTETIIDMHIGSGHFGNVSLNYNSTPDTYTLYIDDTDCTVSPTVFTVIYGKNLNAEGTTLYGQNSLPIPTKTGYNFQGYAKQEGSTDLILRYKNNKVSPTYAFNDGNFVVDHQNKASTIYPVFQAKTITIVYFDDRNGNSNTSSSYGASVTLPSRQSANYNFLGWYTAQTGGDFVGDGGDTYTILSETTPIKLYARWEAKEYTITFVDGSGEEESVVWTGRYGSGVSVSYPVWTKTGYTISWSRTIPNTVPGNNIIITASWVLDQYLITFVDGDGEIIQTGMVAYGEMPEYTGVTPTKTATDEFTYTFNNTWSPVIDSVTGEATYEAQFDSTVNEYLITWNYRNSEGEMVIVTGIVEYGETPVAPVLPGTCQSDSTIYTFIGWDPVIDSVIGDTTYIAQYDSVDRTYTVSFTVNTERYGILNPWSIIAAYGSAITESGNQMIVGGQTVTATASGGDEQYSYEFNRWENECADTVTHTCTITAVFDRLVNQYTVTFVDEDGVTVLGSDTVNYGGTAVYTGETPTKDATAQYTYTFDDWYTDVESGTVDGLDNVISNRNVYARYTSIANRYSITFVDGSGENENVVWTGDYGTDVSVDYPVWTKAGYTVSWDKEIPDTFPAEDTIITASWTKNPTTNGGYHLKKDNCPGGDYSNSYYDGDCGSAPDESDNQHHSADKIEYDVSVFNPQYSDEMNQAYQYSYYYGITTQAPISEANIDGNLTRVAMAKMLSQYAVKVLGIKPDTSRNNKFNDVSDRLDSDYDDGVTLAYQLGIMGINMPNNEFLPYKHVTRAEFATALSRLLYQTSDGKYENTSKYYVPHISKLAYEGILTNTDPSMKELRGYVMLMLMRSAK